MAVLQAPARKTTTVRVPLDTRDMLTEQARSDGLSVSAYLTRLAKLRERDEWFAGAREASRLDALNPEAMAEQELWDETDDDWD